MRRELIKALSIVLSAAISPTAGAQDHDPRAVEYGIPPMNEPVLEPDPVPPPVYGIPPIVLVELQGQVVSAERGKPLRGVRVTGGGQQVFTDREGRFALSTHITEDQLGNAVCLTIEDVDGRRRGGRFVATELYIQQSELGTDVVVGLERR